MTVISKTVADLRATFRAKVPGGPVLIRPANRHYFLETDEEEIQKIIDEVEKLFLRRELGDKPTLLEQFAVRVLSESYF
jgi:hypothetical protein